MSGIANGRSCGTCRHFLRTSKIMNQPGECHARPPTPVVTPAANGLNITGMFAPVHPMSWCSEWERECIIEQAAQGQA